MDAISINISGRRFEISQRTFLLLSQAMATKFQTCPINYVHGRKEYYFERHAEIFQNVLYYYATGELHMPVSVCPSMYGSELKFWEIDPCHLSKCCYNRYALFLDNQKKLKEFEEYFQSDKFFKPTASKWHRVRQLGWELMNDPFSSAAAEVYFWVSISLVIFNIVAICLASHPQFQGNIPLKEFPDWLCDYVIRHYGKDMYIAANISNMTYEEFVNREGLSVAFSLPYLFLAQVGLWGCFAVEFCFLLLFCPSVKAFLASPLHIVDFLSILPFCIWFIMDTIAPTGSYIRKAESVLSGLAILRVFRLLRLARRIKGLRILLFSIKSSFEDVFLLALMLLMSTVIFASLMYYVDNSSTFPSIAHGFWWAIVTMTTVGYGDQVPQSVGGKLLGSLCAVSGVIIVALTVPVFVSQFQLYYTNTEISQSAVNPRKPRHWLGHHDKTQVHPQ